MSTQYVNFIELEENEESIKKINNLLKKFSSNKILKKYSNKVILQRIKTIAIKSIVKMMDDYFQKLPGLSSLKSFKNLSNKFFNTKSNSKILNMTIEEIFSNETFCGKLSKNYQRNIFNISLIKKEHFNDTFLKSKLKDVLYLYYESEYYEKDLLSCLNSGNTEHEYYLKRLKQVSESYFTCIKSITI